MKGSRRLLILLACAIVVVAIGGYFLVRSSQGIGVELLAPSNAGYVSKGQVEISCSLHGFNQSKDKVSVLVDGHSVGAVSLSATSLGVTARLADGPHEVTVEVSKSGIFASHTKREWSFTVDTVLPQVQVTSPTNLECLGSSDVAFGASASEPVKSATLTLDGTPMPVTISGARLSVSLTLKTGEHHLALSVADMAGNRSTKEWDAFAEFESPTVENSSWPGETWKKSVSSLKFTIRDERAAGVTVTALLDGKTVGLESAVKKTSAKKGATSTTAISSNATKVDLAMSTRGLSEGTHTIKVQAQNLGGHTTVWEKTIVVDTTETFGTKSLGVGAVGKDVKALQQLLSKKGFYSGQVTSTLDSGTEAAVKAFQNARNISVTGIVDRMTLQQLAGYIRIDRAKHTLYLYLEGKLVKTYSVAVGQPAYPTPTGYFSIIVKEVNPTWNPPDSDWAKGEKAIGPGPDNPLGTRWMGLSADSVGIHGTPHPESIGTSASHGCIRMRISDAEDLFGRVVVGTQVEIFD